LPVSLRQPLILCCLEGRTRDEAAALLGCSVSAVKGRLERGREMLRQRLKQRGVQLPLAFLTLTLTSERIRAVLWAKTMQTALYTPAPAIVALAEAAIPAMTAAKYKIAAVLMLLVMGTAGALGHVLHAKPQATPTLPAKAVAESKKPQSPQVRTDRHGDPLPDGAIARLGTVRWRHGVFVHALAYSPDGKKIVSSGVGRALVLWDASTGKELRQFASRGQPHGVVFSPDGKYIAAIPGMAQVWEVATGKKIHDLNDAKSVVIALAFAPDGKTLATANSDNAIHLWDPANGEEKRRIDCGQGGVTALAYSPDGTTLASGGKDGAIRLWDVDNGKECRRFAADNKEIRSLVFSPDGKHLVVGSGDDTPRLWNVATGREIRTFGEKQGVFAPLALSPDGKWLATGYADGTVSLWDAASGEEKRHWRAGWGKARAMAFSPDGKTLASALLWNGGFRLWDVDTGRERNAAEGHYGPISLLRFAVDNKTLISGGFDRSILWWDMAAQTPRRRFTWTTDSFSGFALSPDGNMIAVADINTDEMFLWDIGTGKAAKLTGKKAGRIQTIAFSPDGRLLASGGYNRAIQVWDVRQGKAIREIQGNPRLGGLLFSPNGKTLASGSPLRLWDAVSGKERSNFDNQAGGDFPLAFSPDGKQLVSANDPPGRHVQPLVRLWDATTGKEFCRYNGHRTVIGAAAFSPDGKLVASGGVTDEDNSVQVWEAATGHLIRRFEGHHSWLFAVVFAADGLTVASSAGDSTILLWDITGRRSDGRWHAKPLSQRQLDTCWSALANDDAAKAYDAVWMLIAAPEQAVPFLRKHLPPVPRPNAKYVAQLIADLDSETFAARQRAAEELSNFGDAITDSLRKALADKPSLEMRRRIQQLLDRTRDWTPERLRVHRAIQALEHINTRSARELLQALAEGTPQAQRTEEAKETLRRLKR
jgi:WD40 repeat protein